MSLNDCSLDDVAQALKCLDCADTDVWLRAGMAIKTEFGEGGFDVWDAWSQGDKRYKQKETLSKWKSFKGSSARGSVSIGTVFHWAFARGFKFERPELTPEQKAAFAKECEERRAKREAEILQEDADQQRWYDVVAAVANNLVPMLKPTGVSKYLGVKKVGAYGLYFAPHSFVIRTNDNFTVDVITDQKDIAQFFEQQKAMPKAEREKVSFYFFKKGSILVPLRDIAGTLKNFQIIFTDGKSKRFLTNGRKSGYFHLIGEITDGVPIIFCEGYATGASLHKATGWPVVVCFDAGNMPVVAEQFADFPHQKIFAGDNDWETALDPKKKNTGLVKAQEAARIGGGTWCVPLFTGDATGLSDFNDLHVAEGLPVVKAQLETALEGNPVVHDLNQFEVPLDMVSPDSPPDMGELGDPVYDFIPPDNSSPEPSLSVEQLTIEGLLSRYALTDPDAKVWDSLQKKIIKAGAFKNIIRPALYKEWLEHEKRRTVLLDDVAIEVASAQKRGRGGLAQALNRYVYLNPSDSAWDKIDRQIVALSHLKYAIADCFDMWVKHPDREEIPHKNLVFDPTQQCDTQTHINQFRGLAIKPSDDLDKCRGIIEMLMGLCNRDMAVFKWLKRWLAYPLINVGAKMETSVLCHSDVHGSGKSYFFDVVMRGIYGEYSRTVGQAQLEGQYNDWMSKVLYCVYEEVLSRSQRYSHTGTIKQTITGKTVRIEKKFMSGWEEANHMNSVFLSNEVLPLPVEPSDRRFLVIWPEAKLYERLQRAVDIELKNGGAEAFYRYLLNTSMQDPDEDYPFDEHTKPPMTEAKARLIEHGRPIWEVFYNEWQNGALYHNDEQVPFCSVRTSDLYAIFQTWCKRNNEHGMGAHKFSSFIGSKVKKRPDVHFKDHQRSGKSVFYLIGAPPEGKSQEEWLAGCVGEFMRIFAAGVPDHGEAA
ncbi:MAG TPA: PriCT-2 domain-containing protein [Cellvibrio sp.]|nr:PriCT-2 domain-containing protein [Cellvibrio sp.]